MPRGVLPPCKKPEMLVFVAVCNFSSGLVIKFTFKALQWYQVQAKFESSCGGENFNISPGKWTGKLVENKR